MFKFIKNKFSVKIPEEIIKINPKTNGYGNKEDEKLLIRKFIIKHFPEIHPMINIIGKSRIVALINVKALIDKRDQLDFRRIVKILKDRCNETNGDIALLENWIVLTPEFVRIDRGKKQTSIKDYYM